MNSLITFKNYIICIADIPLFVSLGMFGSRAFSSQQKKLDYKKECKENEKVAEKSPAEYKSGEKWLSGTRVVEKKSVTKAILKNSYITKSKQQC